MVLFQIFFLVIAISMAAYLVARHFQRIDEKFRSIIVLFAAWVPPSLFVVLAFTNKPFFDGLGSKYILLFLIGWLAGSGISYIIYRIVITLPEKIKTKTSWGILTVLAMCCVFVFWPTFFPLKKPPLNHTITFENGKMIRKF